MNSSVLRPMMRRGCRACREVEHLRKSGVVVHCRKQSPPPDSKRAPSVSRRAVPVVRRRGSAGNGSARRSYFFRGARKSSIAHAQRFKIRSLRNAPRLCPETTSTTRADHVGGMTIIPRSPGWAMQRQLGSSTTNSALLRSRVRKSLRWRDRRQTTAPSP